MSINFRCALFLVTRYSDHNRHFQSVLCIGCPEFVFGPTSDYGHTCFVDATMRRAALCLTKRVCYCSLAFMKKVC